MKVSIVIACCNEKAIIEKILEPVHDAANFKLTDMEKTGYKAFRTSLIRSIQIEEGRFGVEPEAVANFPQRQSHLRSRDLV